MNRVALWLVFVVNWLLEWKQRWRMKTYVRMRRWVPVRVLEFCDSGMEVLGRSRNKDADCAE